MRYLIDTHVLVWWLEDSDRQPNEFRSLIADATNEIFVSKASAWEIEIKRNLGKLDVPADFMNSVEVEGFQWLPIELRHIKTLSELPDIHRDPFDRMLVAQAKAEGMPLLSADSKVNAYAQGLK